MSERGRLIIQILRASRETGVVTSLSQPVVRILRDVGAEEHDSIWVLDRQTRIRLAQEAVSQGVDIESIVDSLTWKDFESLVASVLRENGFRCIESLRRRGDAIADGMEIDVVGVRGHNIVSVDAKMWGTRHDKTSALVLAAKRQNRRTTQLTKMLPILAVKLSIQPGRYTFIPVLVTWLVEDIELVD